MIKQHNEEMIRKTLDFNFEVNMFNDRLKSHLDIRTLDLQLLDQLQTTTELISLLISDFTLVDLDTINFREASEMLQLHRQVYCRACNTAIKTDVVRVQDHLTSETHQQALKKSIKKEQKKKNGKSNVENTTQLFLNSKIKGTENNEINPITLVPTENVQTVDQNICESQPKLSKKVIAFIRDRNLEKLARTLADESERIKMSSKHYTVVESIQKALVSKYPNIKVYPFGSRISGLGSKGSDLDLFVDLDNQYFSHAYNIASSEFKYIEQQLKKTKQWIDFYSITGARTPILQAFFHAENLPCDLSFSNGLSHCNTKLISYFISLQPLFAKIALIVKEWAHAADMKINSYALTFLVVFYFQHVNLLPTVLELQKNEHGALFIGHWSAYIGTISWTEKSNDFRNHLIGFFNYYGNIFDFQKLIVCPYLGISLEKKLFHYGRENLPEELQAYMSYMKKIDLFNADGLTDLFAYEKPMVVQDPFELIHNVTKGILPTTCERFVNFCKLTADFLKTKRVL